LPRQIRRRYCRQSYRAASGLVFEGTADDDQAGDTGVQTIELGPWSDNLQIVSTEGVPGPNATFTVGLVSPSANGRGYVRVTDGCGWRSYVLVDIDAVVPMCSGEVGNTKRYVATDLPAVLPDNNVAGVTSSIIVPDTDLIADVDLTFNIVHGFAADIDMTLTSPTNLSLMTDIGSTGNNFIDTTFDDEAAAQIPNSSTAAPWTGSFQPEGGPMLFVLDGAGANGTYSLRVADDAEDNAGTWESWALTIESATFPPRYDGRVEESGAHQSGICSVELLPGSTNLTLLVDAFDPGGDHFVPRLHVVRYSVELTNPDAFGEGTVVVTDCAGNTCEIPICMEVPGTFGDLDGSGTVGDGDWPLVYGCITGPDAAGPLGCGCGLADFDSDGDVDLADHAAYQQAAGMP